MPAGTPATYVKTEDRTQALATGFRTRAPRPEDPDEPALVIARLAGLSRPLAS